MSARPPKRDPGTTWAMRVLVAALAAVLLIAAPADAARLRSVGQLKAVAKGDAVRADVEGPRDAARPATRSGAPA